jgi:endonuclease-3
LGLTQGNTQDKIEKDLMVKVPRKDWGRMHTLLIIHGRTICTARNRQCERCPFAKSCPSSKVMGREDRAGIGHKSSKKPYSKKGK